MNKIAEKLIPRFVLRDTFETFGMSMVAYLMPVFIFYSLFTDALQPYSNGFGIRGLILLVIIPLTLTLIFSIITFFKYKYGTYARNSWAKNERLLLRVNGDEVIDSDNVFVWGKDDVHRTKVPYSFSTKFSVDTSIEHKNGNLRVSIPATIIIHHNSNLNPQEVYDIVVKKWEDNSLINVIKKVFQEKVEENRSSIDYLIGMYSNKEIPEKELLLRISDLIDFPEKMFSNFEKSSFTLGEPQLYVCKGSACVS